MDGQVMADLKEEVFCDPQLLDEHLGLQLEAENVPMASLQMIHAICGVFRTLFFPPFDFGNLVISRDWIMAVFMNHGLLGWPALPPRGERGANPRRRQCAEECGHGSSGSAGILLPSHRQLVAAVLCKQSPVLSPSRIRLCLSIVPNCCRITAVSSSAL